MLQPLSRLGRRHGVPAALALTLLAAVTAAEAQELSEKIEICNGCHGEAGRPSEPDIPIIWGQEFYYLYVQLKDYKAGRRTNEIMSDIVIDLSKEEMQALSQYFSEQTWPTIGYAASDADVARGGTAADAGQCPQCHLGKYQGNSRVPRLSGQQSAYLERTMFEFKNKVRLNSPAKGSLFAAYEDADITAMAHFLAGF